MARERKNYQVRTTAGAVVANPTITVYNSGGFVLASIYSDDIGPGTPLANPFTGSATGTFFFYANDGRYDVLVTGTGIAPYTLGAENFVYAAGAPGGGIISINAQVGVAQTLQTGTSGTDFAVSSLADVHTFNLPTIGGAGVTRGVLSVAQYNSFLSRIISLNTLTDAYQTFVPGTAGTDFAVVSAGGVHTFNIPTIGGVGVSRGLLSTADYASFAAKQAALPAGGTVAQYVRGNLTLATLDSSVVPENTNLYYTDARARAAISGTAPVSVVAGVVSMAKATTAVDGYLAAADFTTFFAKLGSLNGSTVATQTFAVGTAGTDFAISTNAGAGTHTFNIPDASAANRGLVTNAAQSFSGVKTFNNHPLEMVDGKTMPVDDVFYVRTTTLSVASDNTEQTIHEETWPAPISAGRVFDILEGGTLQCSGANTITFKLYFGGTQVWSSGAISPASTASINFYSVLNAVVRIAGAGGELQVNGHFEVDDSTALIQIVNTNTPAVNLTGTPHIKLTAQLSNSGANDTFTVSSGIWRCVG